MKGGGQPPAQGSDLHEQTAAQTLIKRFRNPDVSYILLDTDKPDGVLAKRWEQADKEIPIGSLIKPFLAIVYRDSHREYPTFICTGKRTCWYPRGHGKLTMRNAIAYSCNSYFRQLNESADHEAGAHTLDHNGLHVDANGYSGSASPIALARAYLELAGRRQQAELAPVFDGMAMSARVGTARAAGAAMSSSVSALAKTGTAPCIHGRRFLTDGFTVLLFPADHPRMVLLVRQHARTGAVVAALAGQMVAAMEAPGEPR